MATSRTFEELARRFRERANEVPTNVEIGVRRAAIAANQVLVSATPVDTGRARANYFVSIGQPSDLTSDSTTAEASLRRGRQVIPNWTVDAGGLYITNNLPYILFLDQGSSEQAPNGMSGLAIQAAARQLRNTGLLS